MKEESDPDWKLVENSYVVVIRRNSWEFAIERDGLPSNNCHYTFNGSGQLSLTPLAPRAKARTASRGGEQPAASPSPSITAGEPASKPPSTVDESAEPATRTTISMSGSGNISGLSIKRGSPYLLFTGSESPKELSANLMALDRTNRGENGYSSYRFLGDIHAKPVIEIDGRITKFSTVYSGKQISGFVALITDGFLQSRHVLLLWNLLDSGKTASDRGG